MDEYDEYDVAPPGFVLGGGFEPAGGEVDGGFEVGGGEGGEQDDGGQSTSSIPREYTELALAEQRATLWQSTVSSPIPKQTWLHAPRPALPKTTQPASTAEPLVPIERHPTDFR